MRAAGRPRRLTCRTTIATAARAIKAQTSGSGTTIYLQPPRTSPRGSVPRRGEAALCGAELKREIRE